MASDFDFTLKVVSTDAKSIQIETNGDVASKEHGGVDSPLKIGGHLKIATHNHLQVISIITGYKIKDTSSSQLEEGVAVEGSILNQRFLLETKPIGHIIESSGTRKFKRGLKNITIPPGEVALADDDDLKVIYGNNPDKPFIFSKLALNEKTEVPVDGNKFFAKHIGIVGSTGSGKSGTVAKILQSAMQTGAPLNNSHIIIFDMHGEYKDAFPVDKVNYLSVDNDSFVLPYWLMNGEELEDMFIESQEQNSHNQISQFRYAVKANKEKHNPSHKNIYYDTPVYFDINEVFNYIKNKNSLTVYEKSDRVILACLGIPEIEYSETLLWNQYTFISSTGVSKHPEIGEKIQKYGGFNGEFDRFVPRLENKINDPRWGFLLNPKKDDGEIYKTVDLQTLIQKITGYKDKKNITIIDLSGIPFEVVSLVVSLITRLSFDIGYQLSKRPETGNDKPFLLVYEEAHQYVPNANLAKYKPAKIAVERVAKEGRKYGVSMMVVSQRPSEVSDTIFSQCANFVAMRLTNPTDQNYIKKMLPDSMEDLVDNLSSLERREALLIGDAISVPALVKINEATLLPKSHDVDVLEEWEKAWQEETFAEIVTKMTRATIK